MRHYPPHVTDVATLPWDIKNSNFLQIFSKSANKLHFTFTDLNSSTRVTVYIEYFMRFIKILSSSLNTISGVARGGQWGSCPPEDWTATKIIVGSVVYTAELN